MSRFGQSWSQRVLVVTAAGVCAAAAPGIAHADDGAEPAPLPAAEIAAVPELEESVTAIVVDAIEGSVEGLDATGAIASDDTDDPEEEAGSSGAAPQGGKTSVETSAVEAEQPSETRDPASEAESEHDTVPSGGDTAPGSTAAAVTEVGRTDGAHPAATETSAPAISTPRPTSANGGVANVNVSVRIGSPGDNGAVTQSNTGGSATSAGAPGVAPAAAPSAPSAETRPATASAPESTWYWEWNCLGSPVLNPISPDRSNGGSVPQTWTWIWNCPSNSDRYQQSVDPQSQQLNANVSIRISSPGDDGPVVQTNIAAGVGAELQEALLPAFASVPSLPPISIPVLPISLSTISAPLPPVVRDVPGIAGSTTSSMPMMPSLTLAPALPAGSDTSWAIEVGGEPSVEAAVDLVDGTDVPPVASEPLVPSERVAPVERVAPAPRAAEAHGLRAPKVGPASVERDRADIESTVAGWAADSPEPAAVTHHPRTADTPSRTRPAPSWKPSAATRAPAATPSGTSASAAGAGGSSGGGLPIFLALPFLAAVLDLARRVALERVTWPSGHRRRMPDTPG
jgi:hypothetical protein